MAGSDDQGRVRFPVPDELCESIKAESYIIDEAFESGSEIVGAHEGFLSTLNSRLIKLCQLGQLYVGLGPRTKIPWSTLTVAQAEIARVHGLAYHKHPESDRLSSFLRPRNLEEMPFHTRAESYLRGIMGGLNRTILKRLDAALLAHAFGLPVSVLESPFDATFEDYLARTRRGEHLFRTGSDFLQTMAFKEPVLTIQVVDDVGEAGSERTPKHRRGFGARLARSAEAEFPVHRDLMIQADLSAELGRHAQAILIGLQEEQGVLLSTSGLMDRRLDVDGSAIFPRNAANGASDRQRTKGPGIWVDSPGDVDFFVVAASSGLDSFPAWQRSLRRSETEAAQPEPLHVTDFRWLREQVLRYGQGGPNGVVLLRRSANFG